MKLHVVESGEGKHRVFLHATVTGRGIMAVLAGGDEPHLGAVVLTLPRQSLANPKVVSCTSSVLPLLGHRDDEAARPLAEMLARETDCPVSIAAGIHVHNAGTEDIQEILKNCMACGTKLLEEICIKKQNPGRIIPGGDFDD